MCIAKDVLSHHRRNVSDTSGLYDYPFNLYCEEHENTRNYEQFEHFTLHESHSWSPESLFHLVNIFQIKVFIWFQSVGPGVAGKTYPPLTLLWRGRMTSQSIPRYTLASCTTLPNVLTWQL